MLAVAVVDRICCDTCARDILAVFGARRVVRPILSRVASGCAPFLVDADQIWHTQLFLLRPLPAPFTSCFLAV